MSEEIWKSVVGYEGVYEVSSLGKVRSIRRLVWRPGKYAGYITVRGGIVRYRRGGYPSVSLCKEGKSKDVPISRLVLEAFVGPCPDGMEACHFPDRDPENNRLDNLSWGTRKENQLHRKIHQTSNKGKMYNVGMGNPNAKLTERDVRVIRIRCECGESPRIVAKCFGVSAGVVERIVCRKSWRQGK
jgi:hypothetical protein